jgi:hypothetical protein
MSAVMLADLASEVMENADFRGFLERNKLTFDAAAAQLGISSRLVSYVREPAYARMALACACLHEKLRRASSGSDPGEVYRTSTVAAEKCLAEPLAQIHQE